MKLIFVHEIFLIVQSPNQANLRYKCVWLEWVHFKTRVYCSQKKQTKKVSFYILRFGIENFTPQLTSKIQVKSSELEILDDVAADRHVRTRPRRVESGRSPTRFVRSSHGACSTTYIHRIVPGALLVLEQLLEDGQDLSRVHLV